MIFVSSSCSKKRCIGDAILELVSWGFRNIELSGGTNYYSNLIEDLINYKTKFNLKYLVHNYFPPPESHFVLNLASTNADISQKSLDHIKNAISLCQLLGSGKYGFHAGFFADLSVNDLGNVKEAKPLTNESLGESVFVRNVNNISSFADPVKIYIENNVVSQKNYLKFKNNPFLLTSRSSFNTLKQKLDFNLLLDIAHLKVSCCTLGLSLEEEFFELYSASEYIHVSDNDGLSDENNGLEYKSELYDLLKSTDKTNKTFTLEVYSGVDKVIKSYELIESI